MGYDLVFRDGPSDEGKVVGENVFFEDLPEDYKVYVFSYPGDMPDLALEARLRKLGEITGKNLFVNIGRLNDPLYSRISKMFGIRSLPAVIVTAEGALASLPGEYRSAYARLDDKRLLASPERTAQRVLEVSNLFLQGKVREALSLAKGQQHAKLARAVGQFFSEALKSLAEFVANLELSFSVAEGKFELKRRG